MLLITIVSNGYSALFQTYVKLDIELDKDKLSGDLSQANYNGLIKDSLYYLFPDVKNRRLKRQLTSLVSPGAAFELRKMVLDDPGLVGQRISIWLPADDDVDMAMKDVRETLREKPHLE